MNSAISIPPLMIKKNMHTVNPAKGANTPYLAEHLADFLEEASSSE